MEKICKNCKCWEPCKTTDTDGFKRVLSYNSREYGLCGSPMRVIIEKYKNIYRDDNSCEYHEPKQHKYYIHEYWTYNKSEHSTEHYAKVKSPFKWDEFVSKEGLERFDIRFKVINVNQEVEDD